MRPNQHAIEIQFHPRFPGDGSDVHPLVELENIGNPDKMQPTFLKINEEMQIRCRILIINSKRLRFRAKTEGLGVESKALPLDPRFYRCFVEAVGTVGWQLDEVAISIKLQHPVCFGRMSSHIC